MKALRSVPVVWALLGGLSCAPAIDVNYDYDPETDFTAVKTFDWLPQPAAETGGVRAALQRNGLLDSRIKRAVTSQLTAKGYTQAARDADVMLMYHTGTRERVDVTDWGYGYGRGRLAGGGLSVYQYTEGTLLLDVIDARTRQLIWRGVAKGTVDPNAAPETREQRINEAVGQMLANFPPTRK